MDSSPENHASPERPVIRPPSPRSEHGNSSHDINISPENVPEESPERPLSSPGSFTVSITPVNSSPVASPSDVDRPPLDRSISHTSGPQTPLGSPPSSPERPTSPATPSPGRPVCRVPVGKQPAFILPDGIYLIPEDVSSLHSSDEAY